MNKVGTARLYIDGEYIADVSIDKSPLYEEATEQYKEDENLGRLLWKLDGVRAEVTIKAKKEMVCICGGSIQHGKTDNMIEWISFKFDNIVGYDSMKEEVSNNFLKYSGNRKGKKGKKYPIMKKNY